VRDHAPVGHRPGDRGRDRAIGRQLEQSGALPAATGRVTIFRLR
jgi:hypothetical protein